VDQMGIHSASDLRPRTTLCGDYFYNYFTRGLDILFDGKVCIWHRVFVSLHDETTDNGNFYMSVVFSDPQNQEVCFAFQLPRSCGFQFLY